jgi:hypothetical protein
MSKSRLSTEAIKRLRRAQIKLDLIAKLAGITPNGVRNRVHPKSNPYRFGSAQVKDTYVAKQRQRQQDYQRQSLEHAANFGEWTPAEIRYREKNARDLTRLEIAKRLQRTYFSVSHYVVRHGTETRN